MRSDEIVLLLLFSFLVCCSGGDTLKAGENITDEEGNPNLVSENLTFELGFFPLSEKRYLGIWYHMKPRTVVWVANREKGVLDSSGVFEIAEDGNLVVEGKGASGRSNYWSSQLEASSSTNRTVRLLDSGNLVLMDHDRKLLWQSFLNPTDTFLPGMKMEANLTLTSWRDATDPAPGDFTFKLSRAQNFQVERKSQLYWAFDRLDTETVPPMIFLLLDNGTMGKVMNGSQSYDYKRSRLLMNYSSGEIEFLKWNETLFGWDKLWWGPADKCDKHNYCGSFGICNKNNVVRCKCLPGFRPKHNEKEEEFQLQGCVRKSTTSCIDKDVMFLNFGWINVDSEPDQQFNTQTEAECQSLCHDNSKCPRSQCQAYSFSRSIYDRGSSSTCKIWTRDLPTLLEDYDRGLDLSVLVNRSDIELTARSCKPCGTNVIPYPLSTGPDCGNPMYNRFNCSNSTGQVRFMIPDGDSYPVNTIDEDTRVFYIQTPGSYSCSSGNQTATPDYPFYEYACFEDVGIVKMSWLPAPEPPCTKPIDCKYWPHSTCTPSSQGGTRCLCDPTFKWNNSTIKCTQEAPSNHSTIRLLLILTLGGTAILACIIAFAIVRRMRKNHTLDRANTRIQESLYESERHVKGLIGLGSLEEKGIEGIEVPCYTFASILAATDNFSDSNKLGRGGYGPVYKGRFPGGQYIAVKRLSSVSTQGLQEFKNEVILIAKLQHRNLVRLRGYCIKGYEKILLYEYMSNKSLDSFIFDRTRTLLLDWPMRFEIIIGIARGMLYLHQDSRLRVIHRDLKTSNILLDEEMNPKISDFGLAKIFGGKETEASTERVVGTYGYMAPEYALDGLFSIKSDVFSFGVVLLEIISGKKNTGFYQSKQISSLLGYTWKLWTENKLLDLMEPSFAESCNENQFIKCALIGLLCIQDEPGDRPTMSNVLTMLDSETASMPLPTQPTFFVNKHLSSSASSSSKPETSLQFDTSYQDGR
uniref:non-specific serine/threonine protein kinase n=1 Tax=Cajanus cajan TaxID=3821 RepID=A0A151RP79_CAJCA|nr:Cysteine-rich receptor-like protein kinase 6 [Cajanus cajan]